MTYGVVAIHYQGDDKFTLARVDRVNLRSSMSYSSRFRRVVGLSANKEGTGERAKGAERGSSGILATLSINATYRDLCLLRRGESAGEKKKTMRRRRKRMVVVSRRDEVAARRSGDHTESRALLVARGGPFLPLSSSSLAKTLLSLTPFLAWPRLFFAMVSGDPVKSQRFNPVPVLPSRVANLIFRRVTQGPTFSDRQPATNVNGTWNA